MICRSTKFLFPSRTNSGERESYPMGVQVNGGSLLGLLSTQLNDAAVAAHETPGNSGLVKFNNGVRMDRS